MNENKTTEELNAEIAESKRRIAVMCEQVKAQQDKTNQVARQFLEIAKEKGLSIADMEQVLTTVKAFLRVHARCVFDEEVFDAWSSPGDMFSMGMASFEKGLQLLD